MLPAFIVRGDDRRAVEHGKPASWATLDAVVDHVAHLIDVMGEDHVGIGTDWGKPYYSALTWDAGMVNEPTAGFDWVGWRPHDNFDPNAQVVDLETWDKWPNLTAALLQRGLTERQVVKIVGGNFLRVLREVCG
jgi:membrane dipeptidase